MLANNKYHIKTKCLLFDYNGQIKCVELYELRPFNAYLVLLFPATVLSEHQNINNRQP